MSTIGVVALSLLFGWVVGGVLMRLAGLAFVLIGLGGLTFTGNPEGVLIAAVGTFFWLLGHGHHALRRGTWKSPLARSVWRMLGTRQGEFNRAGERTSR